jgi:sphinganine-1-phosphate aldolase
VSTAGHNRKPFPGQGTAWSELQNQMRDMASDDVQWREGQAAVYVFDAGEDVRQVAKDAYGMFISENGLGMRAFPSLAGMQRDVLDFGLDLLRAPAAAGGALTSGGTESIFLALKTCRDYWRSQGRDVSNGKILAARTAHPAFNKAAEYLGLQVVRCDWAADFKADPQILADHVDADTLMLVGSAPCFPFGVMDPIAELAEVAKANNLWLHVDACVGGYLAPFVAMNGVDLPAFDFSIDGVTSISADLHKYGYAAKGASTVFYRDAAMLAHQQFEFSAWPNGTMVTPSFTGTRPGGAIAAAWAVLNYLGRAGYCAKAAEAVAAREKLQAGLAEICDLQVHGTPQLSLINFALADGDIHAIADQMGTRGWVSARTVDPHGLHLMLSPKHLAVMDRYLDDFRQSMAAAVGAKPDSGDRTGFYN